MDVVNKRKTLQYERMDGKQVKAFDNPMELLLFAISLRENGGELMNPRNMTSKRTFILLNSIVNLHIVCGFFLVFWTIINTDNIRLLIR